MGTDTSPAVQPGETPEGATVEGQGAEGIQGLYDLSAAPEELRPLLEQELKKVEANVTRRFQEHADFRKRFEPLADIEGLTDVPGEELQQLLEFREIAGDPQQFESWWFEVGKQLGYFDDDGTGATAEADGDDGETAGNPEVTQLMETVQQLSQRLESYEQQGAQQQARQDIDRQIKELHEQHGEFDENLVLRLARDYVSEPDAIQRGFDDYLRITGQAQSELVEDKLDQPASANGGGRPDTTPEPITNFKQAQAAALQRLGG